MLRIHGKSHAAGNRGLVSYSRVKKGVGENPHKRARNEPEKSRGNVRNNKRGDFAVSQYEEGKRDEILKKRSRENKKNRERNRKR